MQFVAPAGHQSEAFRLLWARREHDAAQEDVTGLVSPLMREGFFYAGAAAFGPPRPDGAPGRRLRLRYEFEGRQVEEAVKEGEFFVARPLRVEGVRNGKGDAFELEFARYGADKVLDFTELARQHVTSPTEYCSVYKYKYDEKVLDDPQPNVVKYQFFRFSFHGRTFVSCIREPNTHIRLLSPIFSVVIPTWNRAPFLRRCVGSVLAQDFDPSRVEVIVVDDGSTDGTAAVMGEICRENPRVAFVRVPHTGCCGLVRNFGVMVSAGAYLAYLDSDDKFLPRHLSAAHERFQRSDYLSLRTWSSFCVLRELPDGTIREEPEDDFNRKLFNRWSIYPSCLVHRRELLDHPTWREKGIPFVTRRSGEDYFYLWDVMMADRHDGRLGEEVVEEQTVMYGLIVGGNNLTYALPEVASEYRDRDQAKGG